MLAICQQCRVDAILDRLDRIRRVNPRDQLSLEDVKTCIGKQEKKATNHPLVTKPSHSVFNP